MSNGDGSMLLYSLAGQDGRIAAQWATRQSCGKDPRMATREASRR